MKTQRGFIFLAIVVFGLTVSSCKGVEPSLSATLPVTETAPETLTIYNWAEYIDPEIVSSFEVVYNAKVRYITFEAATELFDNVKNQRDDYDLVIATDYIVMALRREKLLAPLNKANIPNIRNLDPFFISPQFDPDNRFCIPYQWGTTAITYNRKATGREITSWGDLFDPQFRGRVSFMDAHREMLGEMLLYFRYSPNTTNADEINHIRDFLIDNHEQFLTLQAFDGYKWVSTGEVDIAVEYNGAAMRTILEDPNINYVIPVEGAIMWTDNMCIPVGSTHKDLAEKFINYIMEPEVGGKLSNYVLYASPNIAALPYINSNYSNSTIMYPSAKTRERLFYLVDVGADAENLYYAAWQAVLQSHGE